MSIEFNVEHIEAVEETIGYLYKLQDEYIQMYIPELETILAKMKELQSEVES